MAGNLQPLDEKFPIVDQFGKPTLYFIKWCQQRQIDITDALTLLGLEEYLVAHPLQEGSGIQITPDGNLANSPIIAADVQEILDQITTTQGTIIYRNSSDWVALAPGAVGQFLKTNGPGADPVWAAGGGGLTPPTLVQHVVNRGGGAMALPAAPTPGNLMVMFATGFSSISAYGVTGFIQVGTIQNGVNNLVRCWARRVQVGDTGAYVIAATTDKQAILYEFSNANWVAQVAGGATGWTGTNFAVDNPIHPFAGNGQQLLAVETDNASTIAITAETGWTLDYATPGGTAGNHYCSMGRQFYPHDGTVVGTASAAVLTPVWGSFVVTSNLA